MGSGRPAGSVLCVVLLIALPCTGHCRLQDERRIPNTRFPGHFPRGPKSSAPMYDYSAKDQQGRSRQLVSALLSQKRTQTAFWQVPARGLVRRHVATQTRVLRRVGHPPAGPPAGLLRSRIPPRSIYMPWCACARERRGEKYGCGVMAGCMAESDGGWWMVVVVAAAAAAAVVAMVGDGWQDVWRKATVGGGGERRWMVVETWAWTWMEG